MASVIFEKKDSKKCQTRGDNPVTDSVLSLFAADSLGKVN